MDTGTLVAVVGLAIAVLGHAFSTVWWASRISSDLANILKELMKQDIRINHMMVTVDNHSQLLATHTAQIENLK